MTNARKLCIGKFGIGTERIAEYRQRVFRETDAGTPSYVHCVFEELELYKDGAFVTENYVQQLGKGGDYTEKVVGCYDTSGGDPQVRAFRSFMCFLEKGLLPEGY